MRKVLFEETAEEGVRTVESWLFALAVLELSPKIE
jgi:hypothetical protein